MKPTTNPICAKTYQTLQLIRYLPLTHLAKNLGFAQPAAWGGWGGSTGRVGNGTRFGFDLTVAG
ncbi:MAG: hypothetical protein AAGG69_01315 [Pseudomonadota bacterium]